MTEDTSLSRRQLLQRLALGASLVPLGTAVGVHRARAAAALPLLSVEAPEAKAVHYTENAGTAKDAARDTNCANCGLYQGPNGSTQGPCQLFPGKAVKAAGWCSSWAGQM